MGYQNQQEIDRVSAELREVLKQFIGEPLTSSQLEILQEIVCTELPNLMPPPFEIVDIGSNGNEITCTVIIG